MEVFVQTGHRTANPQFAEDHILQHLAERGCYKVESGIELPAVAVLGDVGGPAPPKRRDLFNTLGT